MVDVKIQDLARIFNPGENQTVAVDGIDLTIHDDEFVTLVGPSGCGKTTTLRCVAGLEQPTSGRIMFGDRDVTPLPVQERDIALLFQDVALYPHMSVRDNMAYGLKIEGMSKGDRYEEVEDAAELLQITEQLDKKPTELSGGQQQRVAIGRSLVREPTVFLFDEPMSDLDAKLKRELRPVIQEVTDRIGCPVLYVTHDQEEAMTMSDRVAVINDGRLEQIGPPQEVYENPQSEFVSDFIGQPPTQLFDGRIESRDGSPALLMAEHEVPLAEAEEAYSDYLGESVRIGIRPPHIDVADDPDSGIPASHKLDEPLGDETHSFFDTEFGEVIVVTESRFEGGRREYGLLLNPEEVMLFDPDSGDRIA